MFEYINGTIAELAPTYAVIDIHGVGYLIHISLVTSGQLQDKEKARLYIYQVIREDTNRLYGFTEKGERSLFEALIGVSNVGPNSAITYLSTYHYQELRQYILQGDLNALKAVKGIGSKTAQRIIVDLKDKLSQDSGEHATFVAGQPNQALKEEATSALLMLGFSKSAIQKNLDQLIQRNPDNSVEELVKKALKQL